jgi:putative MATE family efflux protein
MDASKRAVDNTELITSGPIVKAVFHLAVPVVLGMLMEVLLSVTDFYWVGRLGPAAQDAVTSSMIIIWTVFAGITVVSIGVTALVSRYVGAQDPERASFYAAQAVWLATGIGIGVTVAGFLFSSALLDFMEAGEVTSALAVPYLRIFLLGTVPLFWSNTIYAVFRAAGDTRTPTQVGIMVVLINMGLDPLFIFGFGPIPALGVPGAAIATTIAVVAGCGTIGHLMLKGKIGFATRMPFRLRPDGPAMRRITRIGLPIASQQLVFVLVYWFLIGFVHRFGETAGAAMGIGNRMESLSYMTCSGFAVAASTLVGQNLGAKKPDRAARCAWGATGLGVGLTLVFSVLFLGIPEWIASVFSDNPEVKAIAVDYLRILGLSQSAMAVEIILEGAFSGAGDTIPPLVVMLPASVARIPLAWYLAFQFDWGINGIWWTLTITTGFKAVVLGYWFYLGRWKRKKL